MFLLYCGPVPCKNTKQNKENNRQASEPAGQSLVQCGAAAHRLGLRRFAFDHGTAFTG